MNNKQLTFLKILVEYWDIRGSTFKGIFFSSFEFFDRIVDFLFHGVETHQTLNAIGAICLRRSIVRFALKICFLIVHSFSNQFRSSGRR